MHLVYVRRATASFQCKKVTGLYFLLVLVCTIFWTWRTWMSAVLGIMQALCVLFQSNGAGSYFAHLVWCYWLYRTSVTVRVWHQATWTLIVRRWRRVRCEKRITSATSTTAADRVSTQHRTSSRAPVLTHCAFTSGNVRLPLIHTNMVTNDSLSMSILNPIIAFVALTAVPVK